MIYTGRKIVIEHGQEYYDDIPAGATDVHVLCPVNGKLECKLLECEPESDYDCLFHIHEKHTELIGSIYESRIAKVVYTLKGETYYHILEVICDPWRQRHG